MTVSANDNMSEAGIPENYHERISAVAGHRFTINDRTNAIDREKLEHNDGKPKVSNCYTFEWWTPDGTKFRYVILPVFCACLVRALFGQRLKRAI